MGKLDKQSLTAEELSLLLEVDTEIKISSVILSPTNQHLLQQFLKEQEHRDLILANNLIPVNRLLFTGDSGCGKTFLAKAISNHMDYTMLYVNIATALSDNKIASKIDTIFKMAKKGNCVIFFDECDSIAWDREESSSEGDTARKATDALLQNLDQMSHEVIFIAASNFIQSLDKAFKDRFNMTLRFKRPKSNLVQTLQKFMYQNFSLVMDIDEFQLASLEERVDASYRTIQDIVNRAMKDAVISGTHDVKISDIAKMLAIYSRIKILGIWEEEPDA